MGDPTDRPDQQAEPECGDQGDQLVRLDVGGWISGPCLDLAALEPPPRALAEPGWSWSADGSQRPAQ